MTRAVIVAPGGANPVKMRGHILPISSGIRVMRRVRRCQAAMSVSIGRRHVGRCLAVTSLSAASAIRPPGSTTLVVFDSVAIHPKLLAGFIRVNNNGSKHEPSGRSQDRRYPVPAQPHRPDELLAPLVREKLKAQFMLGVPEHWFRAWMHQA